MFAVFHTNLGCLLNGKTLFARVRTHSLQEIRIDATSDDGCPNIKSDNISICRGTVIRILIIGKN